MTRIRHSTKGKSPGRSAGVRNIPFGELPVGARFNISSDEGLDFYWEKTSGGAARSWDTVEVGSSFRFRQGELVRIPAEVYRDLRGLHEY